MLALLVGASVMSIREVSLDNSDIHKLLGQKVTLNFTVTTDPKKTSSGKISFIAKAKGVPV